MVVPNIPVSSLLSSSPQSSALVFMFLAAELDRFPPPHHHALASLSLPGPVVHGPSAKSMDHSIFGKGDGLRLD